ncbi:MAG: CotH kinase family protein, partial [Bacteroidaceae bacterium]|nr:CotH kinase family protein [Bacteroidaceae bacterium]
MKKLLSAIALCLLSMTVVAQDWVDITDDFIANPRLEGNDKGWNGWVSGAINYGYQSNWGGYKNETDGITIYQFVEAWCPTYNGYLGNGKIYQTMKVPKGKYRLSADGIATQQSDASVSPKGAYLYADTDGSVWIAKTPMATANGIPKHFEMVFERSEDAFLNLGIMIVGKESNINWIGATNFKLEAAKETYVALQNMTITPASKTLSPGEKMQLEVGFMPENATIRTCKFRSSNTKIAKVNEEGVVTAIAEGKAEIIAYTASGVQAKCNVTVKIERAPYIEGGLVINEIQASNVDAVIDPSFNFGSWIELYNPTDQACGLGGLYITDDAADLKKHRLSDFLGVVPAHGYKNVWFDHYGIWNIGEQMQVNFKLNYEGGTIIISDGSTILVQQDYPQAIGRMSYARKTDGGDEWSFSEKPTPEKSNAGMSFATTQLEAPIVDKNGQVFSGSIEVNVQIPTGTTLRYTTNGTTPTLAKGLVSTDGKFNVSASTTYRFRLFRKGYLPSEVVTRSYIQDNSGKPIIVMATDEEQNLYSDDYGIFTKGKNGRPGNGQDDNCNWNMDWDRPANFEYITEKNEYAMSQEVDMEVSGGWSRAGWPKAFKIKSAKYYNGKNSLDYQFFDEKPFLKHKVLQIRHGGSGDMLTDAALQETVRRSGLYANTQAVKPVRVYINGKYYGDYNMREPNNKHYAYANYGIDTDLMDLFEMSPDSNYVQKEGTKDAWNTLIAKSKNAANSDTYAEICKLLDIDDYINYMAVELFLGNWDWPQNNVKAFRDRNDGKFHFVIFDLDGSFGGADLATFKSKKNYTFDTLRGEDPFGRWTWNDRMEGEIEFVTLFENMLKNADFRRKFADALCVVGGSVFTPDNVMEVANALYKQVNDGDPNWLSSSCNGRQPNVAQWLTNGTYNFGVTSSQKFNASLSSNISDAGIYVNDMPVPTGKFSGLLYMPVTVKAIVPSGYKFLGWQDTSGSINGNYETKSLFDKKSTWYYYDKTGGLDGINWKTADYAKNWNSGKAPIGYDKSDNPKGLNSWFSNEKLPTYYFCKTFNITDLTANDRFVLDYTVDDGMVVYINGKEAGRYNLPGGDIKYTTYSTTWAHDNPDTGELTLPTNLFKIGENTISVEVHNNDAVSSDIHWDAALKQLIA